MGTLYNPSNLTTNCGFCCIAHALFLQGKKTDADILYLETLERLGLTRVGDQDPIPRQLIFPDPLIDGIPLSAEYQALAERGHGPSSYTITAVASANNLQYQLQNRDLTLPRQFFEFYSRTGPGNWNIADFIAMRMNWLRTQRGNAAPPEASVRRYILDSIGGHSILGSKTVNHFINVHIDNSGHIRAYDAQDGREYSGSGLHARLRTVDLLMHLR
jgi:hypothetical protein